MSDIRIYKPEECAVFCKVKEKHGGNSNMAPGFPLVVNNVCIRTSEALYQACRFPINPEVQKKIIDQCSPMAAKMAGKPFREKCNRKDWAMLQVTIMRWCLRVKLLQNWENFCRVLLDTGDLPIVEKSTKGDDFWGAVEPMEIELAQKKPKNKQPKYVAGEEYPSGTLVGYNVMGRLNQELRENIKIGIDQMSNDFKLLAPLSIEDFCLYGEFIGEIFRK